MNNLTKVLFVCMGNICRSPTAEGVFRKLVEDKGLTDYIQIDSAGTHAYHVGESPDPRAQQAARQRDIDLSGLRGRKFEARDFDEFDYVLAMDQENFNNMSRYWENQPSTHFRLFLDFANGASAKEVPDPYYGGNSGFEYVLDLIENASKGLLQHIRAHRNI